MGRSITSKYAIRFPGSGRTSGCWFVKENGRPTAANLAAYVESYHRSLEPGGVNAHVSYGVGYVPYLTRAVIVLNGTDTVVAEWTAPMFMAVGPTA